MLLLHSRPNATLEKIYHSSQFLYFQMGQIHNLMSILEDVVRDFSLRESQKQMMDSLLMTLQLS